ncbi:hypothetical protein HaLaN_22161, partial [Haematococcus lacustris]
MVPPRFTAYNTRTSPAPPSTAQPDQPVAVALDDMLQGLRLTQVRMRASSIALQLNL